VEIDPSIDHSDLMKSVLAREIESLPENQKLVMALFYNELLSVTEIAKVLRKNESEVTLDLKSALFKIQARFGEIFGDRG
jgi:RNA polymerase sigma factor for flagellar operon FliA